MQMEKSTYYYELNKKDAVALRNTELSSMIEEIFSRNKGIYGVRRVYQELLNRGISVNHKRIQRIMHILGLKGKTPKNKYHSFKGDAGQVAENIIDRNFTTDGALQKWTTDVTQFSFSWGKCYLSPILDMHTNEIISFDLSMSPNLEQIRRMLEGAYEKFPCMDGIILHSDQGWQYRHEYYRTWLKEHGIIQSMSRKGNCYDNAIMESFFGRLKNELYYGQEDSYSSFREFSDALNAYINYFNNVRIQAKTKWMPPVLFRVASICY